MITNGIKNDKEEGKWRWDCVPWEMVECVAKVMTYGAEKYNENPQDPNWVKVEDGENRYFAAMMRHMMADKKGEVIDPDSGHEHIDHFLFNVMAYAHFRKENREPTHEWCSKPLTDDEIGRMCNVLKG